MPSKTLNVTLYQDGPMCFIPISFDPKAEFGKIRAPVKVTLNGHTYRSTIAAMAGTMCIPLRRSHRESAGLIGNETLAVTIELDTETREVELPNDFSRALTLNPGASAKWQKLSYTAQREQVEAIEGARKPETRQRRIANALKMLETKSSQ